MRYSLSHNDSEITNNESLCICINSVVEKSFELLITISFSSEIRPEYRHKLSQNLVDHFTKHASSLRHYIRNNNHRNFEENTWNAVDSIVPTYSLAILGRNTENCRLNDDAVMRCKYRNVHLRLVLSNGCTIQCDCLFTGISYWVERACMHWCALLNSWMRRIQNIHFKWIYSSQR